MKEARPRFRFRPWLALGIAVLHFVIFAGLACFVLSGSLSRATGPGGPNQGSINIAEAIDMILAPPLLIFRLCGIEKLDFQLLLLAVVSSSALYGVMISLLISYILSRRTPANLTREEPETKGDDY